MPPCTSSDSVKSTNARWEAQETGGMPVPFGSQACHRQAPRASDQIAAQGRHLSNTAGRHLGLRGVTVTASQLLVTAFN